MPYDCLDYYLKVRPESSAIKEMFYLLRKEQIRVLYFPPSKEESGHRCPDSSQGSINFGGVVVFTGNDHFFVTAAMNAFVSFTLPFSKPDPPFSILGQTPEVMIRPS